jgi:rod shape-determining protein MreD
MRRAIILFLCTVVLWAIVAQVNHGLSGAHVYLFVGGLFIAFATLTQPFATGLWSAILAGLVLDANAPVAFGKHMILFALTHVMVFRMRDRIARNDTVSRITVAVLANLALFLVLTFLQLIRTPAIAAIWPRMIFDLICSQVAIVIIGRWYFALQAKALVVARLERESFA